MALSVLEWLYRRLGRMYPTAFLTLELQTAFLVALGTLGMFTFYYEGTAGQFGVILAATLGLTLVAIVIAIARGHRRLAPVRAWIGGRRDREQTARAWDAAVNLPLDMGRTGWHYPLWIVAVPVSVAAVVVLELPWLSGFPLFAGALVAIGYGSILHYFALEIGMRPVVLDINRELPAQFRIGRARLPLGMKLLGSLPLINIITGLTVAGLTSGGDGSANLGFNVLVATAVAFTISFELTVLLTKSILRPITDLTEATDAVRRGRYDVAVPVTTSDELGELSTAFNQMVAGLAEREQLREAFGTYLDREVAKYILREGISTEGAEAEVSLLFCDVRDFTSFAGEAGPRDVVAALNELFEAIVPIVSRHGGHVDKFVGDGLLAVFGAPEPHEDHANRAVAAALEMAEVVAAGEAGILRVGIGVNSGPVITGNIGGAGRLNFSVVGDAVNVASRVETATRQTGDPVLITAETRNRLRGPLRDCLQDRGAVALKGKAEPVQLFAPHPVAQSRTAAADSISAG